MQLLTMCSINLDIPQHYTVIMVVLFGTGLWMKLTIYVALKDQHPHHTIPNTIQFVNELTMWFWTCFEYYQPIRSSDGIDMLRSLSTVTTPPSTLPPECPHYLWCLVVNQD